MKREEKFYLLDFFMNEYKWGWKEAVDFVFNAPMDVVNSLYQSAIKRQKEIMKLQTKLTAVAVASGFSGKLDSLDRIFGSEKTDKDQYLNGVRSLWVKMGKDPKKLEEMIKKGKTIVI